MRVPTLPSPHVSHKPIVNETLELLWAVLLMYSWCTRPGSALAWKLIFSPGHIRREQFSANTLVLYDGNTICKTYLSARWHKVWGDALRLKDASVRFIICICMAEAFPSHPDDYWYRPTSMIQAEAGSVSRFIQTPAFISLASLSRRLLNENIRGDLHFAAISFIPTSCSSSYKTWFSK